MKLLRDHPRKRNVTLNRPDIGLAERLAVNSVLKKGNLAQGNQVKAFELGFANFVDSQRCVAVNSGTSALHLGLLSLGIGAGDEVILPSFTFAATANAIALTGAKPVFVDIECDYFAIDPNAVLAAITKKTKAVIGVHLYGHPANLESLENIAKKHSIYLVEDAAQAHLASYLGKPVGSWGDVAAFSFYPTKNMTTGEGGMAVTGDQQTERTLRLLRNQGMEARYQNEIPGFNNRMTEIAAAIGLVQLRKIEKWTLARQANAAFLDKNLDGVGVPKVAAGAKHVYHQYTISLGDLDRYRFASELKRLGVDSDVYYPTPVHELPAYAQVHDLPISLLASKTCLSIPVHQNLRKADLHHIVQSVNFLAKSGA